MVTRVGVGEVERLRGCGGGGSRMGWEVRRSGYCEGSIVASGMNIPGRGNADGVRI